MKTKKETAVVFYEKTNPKLLESILKDDDKSFTYEDKKEILNQIEKLTQENKLQIDENTFKFKKGKPGIIMPIIVNAASLLLILSVVYFGFRYFNSKQEKDISLETQSYFSAETTIIDKIRKESSDVINQKDSQIKEIADRLKNADSEKQKLETTMNAQITEKEKALQEELKQKLELEREKLKSQGLSQKDLELKLKAFEEAKNKEAEQENQKFKNQLELQIQSEKAKLDKQLQEYQSSYETAMQERQKLQSEYKAKEEQMRIELEKQKQAIQEKSTESEQQLKKLNEDRTKEQMITDQINGLYTVIRESSKSGNYPLAKQNINGLKSLMEDASLVSMSSLSKRKAGDLQAISTIEELITFRMRKDAEDKAQAEILSKNDALEKSMQNAAAFYNSSQYEKAMERYTEIFNANPSVKRLLDQYQDIQFKLNEKTLRQKYLDALNKQKNDPMQSSVLYEEILKQQDSRYSDLSADILSSLKKVYEINAQKEAASRDKLLTEKEKTIDEKNIELQKKDKLLASAEEKLKKLNQDLEEKSNQYNKLDKQIVQQSKEIDEMKQKTESKNKEQVQTITLLQNQLKENKEILDKKETELKQKTEELKKQNKQSDTVSYDPKDILNLKNRYQDFSISMNKAINTKNRNEYENALQKMNEVFSLSIARDLFPAFAGIHERSRSVFAITSVLEPQTTPSPIIQTITIDSGREQALNDVLTYLNFITLEDPSRYENTRVLIQKKTIEDPLFKNVINAIQTVVSKNGTKQTSYSNYNYKFIGSVSSLQGDKIIVEYLSKENLNKGITVFIKKTAENNAEVIAKGIVEKISGKKITVKIVEQLQPVAIAHLVFIQ